MPDSQEKLDIFHPDLEPMDYHLIAAERKSLEQFLDYHRNNLLAMLDNLTPAQMCIPSIPPSNITLIGLIRHLTDVESHWFYRIAAGIEPYFEYYTPENPDGDFNDYSPDTVEADIARYKEMLHNVRKLCVKITSLDESVAEKAFRNKYPTNLRWIYLHMIEEYARHLGHADLIRECIDGTTGLEPPHNIIE